jgi:integrase/recombinase XerD
MNVSKAIWKYVSWKQSLGLRYTTVEASLNSFARYTQDQSVREITPSTIRAFLNRGTSSNSTRRQSYDRLAKFFRYLTIHGDVDRWPMPVRVPLQENTFTPYIYSRAEIKRLLNAVSLMHTNRPRRIDSHTFRTLLLFLYGTGVCVSEALTLTMPNIDLKRNVIKITHHEDSPTRTIPIGRDVHRLLMQYLSSRHERQRASNYLFASTTGTRISPVTLIANFQILRRLAGVTRPRTSCYQPRMHDLRHTFAVHRITDWYRHGINAERMIPALAAYMGRVGLRSTERYLALTPEHFRKQMRRVHSGRPVRTSAGRPRR